MRAISPTVFFVCLSSAIRGYFQGYQKMLPTALSQLIESVGKLGFGLVLARYALQRGYPTAVVAAYAGVGLTLGTALSLLYLCLVKMRFSKRERASVVPAQTHGLPRSRPVLGQLARLAVPMTLGASLVSLTKLVDMAMILRRLQSIGFDEIAANEAYGSYTTLALSVFGLIPTLVSAVALPLVPMLSAAIATGEREKQAQMVRLSYLLTAFFALPSALGLAAFAKPILLLLFSGEREAVELAAPLLSYLGASVFLSCMITATNSVLHAYQAVNRPILSMLAGAAVKVALAYWLIGLPSIALAGAPLSTFFCNATVVLLNLSFAASLCPSPALKEVFVRPLLAATGAVGLAFAVYCFCLRAGCGGTLLTLFALALAALLYLLLSFLFGVIKKEELALLHRRKMKNE